jgi:hypothetical protein
MPVYEYNTKMEKGCKEKASNLGKGRNKLQDPRSKNQIKKYKKEKKYKRSK